MYGIMKEKLRSVVFTNVIHLIFQQSNHIVGLNGQNILGMTGIPKTSASAGSNTKMFTKVRCSLVLRIQFNLPDQRTLQGQQLKV